MKDTMNRLTILAAGTLAALGTWAADGVAVVRFDPNGGKLEDSIRVVRAGGTYGGNVNLYPSDATDNFSDLASGRLSLADGVFTYETSSQRWSNFWTKPIDTIVEGAPYTYVIDILTYANAASSAPWFNVGATNGDQPAQLSGAWKQVQGTGRMVFDLTGQEQTGRTVLGRDFVDLNPPDGTCRMTFRVQLYAGKGAVPAGTGPVAAGETAAMALPVPTRPDRVFDCWTDAEGNPVTGATAVPDSAGDTLTLTARWMPWTLDVANGDRPRVGTELTLATNYGDGTREGENGAVSFRWFRGDFAGAYEETPVADGASYTPDSRDLEHFLKGVCYIDGAAALETAIWFSKLPVVYIDTADGADIAFKEDEKSANVRVQGNAAFGQQYDGAAKVKGRGNSTWGLPKKPYKVKLDKKADMFGFGRNKHWVLLANFIDVSSLRNKTAYDMSGEFGLTYQESTWVEVVFNGRFDGTYQFGEHVRVGSTRVDVFDWEEESEARGGSEEDLSWVDETDIDVTGGYLWELSAEYDEVSKYKIDVKGDGESDDDIPVMFKVPEFAATSTRMMDWSKDFWKDVYASWVSPRNTTSDGSKSWKDLCDIDSMVSYWLVNEIFGNHDAWYKSRYCYKAVGGKLTFGPVWDFDWGLGSVAVGMGDAAKWILARDKDNGWAVSFYKEWLDDPWFCLRAWEKYQAMRPKFAELFEGENCTYDEYAAYLAEAGEAEVARWGATRTQSYGANVRTPAEDTAMFKTWMTTRLAWLDTVFATPESLMSAIANHESAHQYFPYTEDREWWDWHTGTYRPNDIGAAVSGQALARNDLSLAGTAAEGTVSVDVLVNGRFIAQVAAGNLGSVTVPKADWYEHGHKTLVELIGYDADGKVTARNHLIVDPVGVGCWEDVGAETANGDILPAAQAAQLDALRVTAAQVAAWALAQKVAFEPSEAISLEAFALNCAPTSAGIAAEKAAFTLRIAIDADGTPRVSLPEGKVYNVEPVIEGRRSLSDGDTWHAPWVRGEDHFFRGVIDIPSAD